MGGEADKPSFAHRAEDAEDNMKKKPVNPNENKNGDFMKMVGFC